MPSTDLPLGLEICISAVGFFAMEDAAHFKGIRLLGKADAIVPDAKAKIAGLSPPNPPITAR
jgi:hypothetical protein